MINYLEQALKIRPFIEKAAQSLSDKDGSQAPTIFQSMKYDNSLIKSGIRINWNGSLMRAASDLWDIEQNNPNNAPTLWEKVLYKDGIRIIPEVITVGLKFSKGEQGLWNNVLMESLIDNNVWNPKTNPEYWKEIK